MRWWNCWATWSVLKQLVGQNKSHEWNFMYVFNNSFWGEWSEDEFFKKEMQFEKKKKNTTTVGIPGSEHALLKHSSYPHWFFSWPLELRYLLEAASHLDVYILKYIKIYAYICIYIYIHIYILVFLMYICVYKPGTCLSSILRLTSLRKKKAFSHQNNAHWG